MEFKFFTSTVTYRVPINPDGTLGNPEILKKFTTETYAPRKKPAKPKPSKPRDAKAEQGEVLF